MQTAVMTAEASDARIQLTTATPTMTPGTAPPLNINASPFPASITPVNKINKIYEHSAWNPSLENNYFYYSGYCLARSQVDCEITPEM